MKSDVFDVAVVGAGSAGTHYAFAAQEEGLRLAVVDSEAETLDRARSVLKRGASFFSDIEEFGANVFVIAVPAGHRKTILEDVMVKEPKSVIVEKILGNSFGELDWLESLSENSGVRFSTHIRWSLNGLDEELSFLEEAENLGTLQSISTQGSGMCAISGGWHWLAYVLEMNDIREIGEGLRGNLEPGPWTRRFGGSRNYFGDFKFSFQGKKLLTVDYLGEGTTAPMAIFEYQFGRVLMTFDGEVGVFGNRGAGKGHPSRYRKFSFEGMSFRSLSLRNPFSKALHQALAGQDSGWRAGLLATRLLLGLLGGSSADDSSAEEKKRQYFKEWPVT